MFSYSITNYQQQALSSLLADMPKRMRPGRSFGHVDPLDKDHAGPEARHAKQLRRALRRCERNAQKRTNTPIWRDHAKMRANILRRELGLS